MEIRCGGGEGVYVCVSEGGGGFGQLTIETRARHAG